ncbi:hypothetical protein PCL_10358 [Purpureocillium lilacinum]|uniref:Uncharacterized protein n=1 Tax=Purpureocillium lilacinum TaxID=33203 RepID=A0A2U3EFU2_PURLI|nr:hypothetical protein PCL_10358 [Purpureocillium lilacinum]
MEVSQTRHWPRNSDRMSPPAHRAVCRLISRRPRLPTSGIVLRSPYWSEPTVWSLSLVVQHRYDDENLARQVTLPGPAFQARGAAAAAVADRRASKAVEGGSRCAAKAAIEVASSAASQSRRGRGVRLQRLVARLAANRSGPGAPVFSRFGTAHARPQRLGRRSGSLPQRSPAWAATGRETGGPALQLEPPIPPMPPNVPSPHGHAGQVPCHATFIGGAWDPAAAAAQRRPHLTRSETRTRPGRRDPLAHAQPHSNFNLTSLAKSPPAPRPTLRHHDTRAAVPWFAARPPRRDRSSRHASIGCAVAGPSTTTVSKPFLGSPWPSSYARLRASLPIRWLQRHLGEYSTRRDDLLLLPSAFPPGDAAYEPKTAAVAHLTSFWSALFFRPNLPPPPARALEPQPGSDSRAALLLLLLLLPANLTPRFTAASVCPVSPPPVRPSAARRHHAAPSSTNTFVSHTHGK